IERALQAVIARALEHRETICIGRTHGVHAEPTTFGLRLAGWAFELERGRERFGEALEGMRVGKLSGAVGTYAATDPELERLACERLGLRPEAASTQVLPRDRHAWLVEGLEVRPERMLHNLEAGHWLFSSQRVLLALVESGLGRDAAYRLVQKDALRAQEEERDFRELVRGDDAIASRVDLDSLFDLAW